MNVLVDSHALIWAVDDPGRLSEGALEVLEDPVNVLWVSAGTVWEIGIKVGLGKLELNRPVLEWLRSAVHDLGAQVLPISVEHAARQSELPFHHRDPFDRLIAAQASHEGFRLVSRDGVFDAYGVERVW